MPARELKLAVIGAGAIGGTTAAFMKKVGWDPILVCTHADTLAQIERQGIQILGLKGEHTVPLRAVQSVADLPQDLDVVFHATKANSYCASSVSSTGGSDRSACSPWSGGAAGAQPGGVGHDQSNRGRPASHHDGQYPGCGIRWRLRHCFSDISSQGTFAEKNRWRTA